MLINKCFKTTIDVYLATFELAIVVLSAAVIIDVCAATPTIRECSDANSAVVAVATACWNVSSSPCAKRHSRVAACANPITNWSRRDRSRNWPKLQLLANSLSAAANSAVDSVDFCTLVPNLKVLISTKSRGVKCSVNNVAISCRDSLTYGCSIINEVTISNTSVPARDRKRSRWISFGKSMY